MKAKVSEFEYQTLLSCSETKDLAFKLLASGHDLVLEGTDEQFDDLRNLCADALQSIGFNEDYSVTAQGLALENLINKLFLK